MTLDAFVLCGHDATRDLSVTAYREPAMQPRIQYAPTGDQHGDTPLGWSYQEAILSFNVFNETVGDTEDDMRGKIAELGAALGRLSYTVAVTIGDAGAETWTCRPGTVAPVDDRDSIDLRSARPLWAVTIPVHPVRSVA